jgi:DNA-binding YbaB/EbfC family protein
MANLGDLMKQAQQLQTKLARIQEEAGNKTVEASVGGNMVTAVVNGRLEVLSLRIDPTVLTSGDAEMLQDLVVAAVNEGIRKAQKMMADEMGKAAGGLKIPGLTP